MPAFSGTVPGRSYRPAAAKTFVEDVQSRGRVGFPLEALLRSTGLEPAAAAAQLRRLRPMVVPVYGRSNYFLIVPPEHRGFGAPPILWWIDDFFAWKQEPYYLGLLSAAAYYGSSHQAVQVTQIMTVRSTPGFQVGRLRLSCFLKKSLRETPTIRAGGGQAPFNVSSPEATALDLVRYVDRIGGITRAAQAIDGMQSRFTITGFRRALRSPLETTLLQRSGYLLETLGLPSFSRLVAAKLSDRRRQATPLTSGTARSEPLHKAWAIYGSLPPPSDW